MSEAAKLYVKIGVDLSALRSGLAEGKASLSQFGSDMRSVGSTLTAAVSAPLALAGGWAIKLAGNLEATALSFRVLTKDAAAALAIQKQLNDYADRSPFESNDVTLAGKRMIAYKFAIKDVMPYLKDAGDLAAAFADQGVKVADIAGVFGRLKSGDFGEAFARLRDFGVSREILEGKGLKFDKSGEYKGSVEDALKAVRSVIQENYGGMADALGTTLPGMLATASDTISRFATDIGKSLVENFNIKEILQDFVDFVNKMRESFNNLSPATQKFVLTIGALAVALPPLAFAIGSIVTAMPMLAAGFAAVTGPIGLVSAAVILLAANWDTVKRKAYEALYSVGKWAGQAMVDLGNKVGSSILVSEGKAQLAKSNSFRGTYMPQQSTATVVGDQSAAEDIRELRKPISNPFKAVADGAKDAAKATKDATRALIELSDARIKAGLDAIKYRDTGGHSIANVVSTVGMMAPKRDIGTGSGKTSQDLADGMKMPSAEEMMKAIKDADIKSRMKEVTKEITEPLKLLSKEIETSLKNAAQSGIEGMAELVGGLFTGATTLASLPAMFGGILADLAKQIGQSMIKFGLAGIAIKNLAISPGLAIAAGAGLIALSGILRSTIGQSIGSTTSKIPKFAGGYGAAYKPTMMMFGDHAGASSNNLEYVLRQDQVKSLLNRAADNAGGGGKGSVLIHEIEGSKLKLILQRANDSLALG